MGDHFGGQPTVDPGASSGGPSAGSGEGNQTRATTRGRVRDPRQGRSSSMLPSSFSTTHSRRPSFDAPEVANTMDNGDTVLGERGRPSYATRLRFDESNAHLRGPSPAYTPTASAHGSPAIQPVPLASPGLESGPGTRPSSLKGSSSRPASLHLNHSPHPSSSHHGMLSPIASAPQSVSNSRESSTSTQGEMSSGTIGENGGGSGGSSLFREPLEATIYEAGAQRPIRPSILEHHHSSSSHRSEPSNRPQLSPTASFDQPIIQPPHHNHPPASFGSLYDQSPTPPGMSRRSSGAFLHASSASNSPSLRATNLPSLSNPTSPALSRRPSRDHGTANGHIRASDSPSGLPAHLISDDHHSPHKSSKRAESRSRSRFNLSAVSSTLRGLSQDIKDRVAHSSSSSHSHSHSSSAHHSNGSTSTLSPHDTHVPSTSRSGSALGFGGSGTGGFGPSDMLPPSSSTSSSMGGAESGGSSRGRRASPTRQDGGSGGNSRSASRSRTRGRNAGTKLLGLGKEDGLGDRSSSRDRHGKGRAAAFGLEDEEVGEGWREFRKGMYHYPISFTIPVSTPPTIHADFGSVVYRLKATVTRSGALTSNLSDEKEVMMIACPGEDETDVAENVVVERQWEEQLRYLVALSGKSFPIGGQM